MQASFRGARSMQTRCGDRYTHRHDAPRRRSSHDCRTGIRRHRGKRRNECGPISLTVDNQPDPPPRGTAACPRTNAARVRRRFNPGRSVWPISVHRRTRIGTSEHPQERPRGRYRQCSSPRATAAGAAWETRPVQDPRPPGAEHAGPGGTRVSGRRGPSLWEAGSRQGESRGPICDPPASPPKRGDDSPGRARDRRPSTDSGEVGRNLHIGTRDAAAWTTLTRLRTDSRGRFRFVYRFRRTFTHHDLRVSCCRSLASEAIHCFGGWSRIRRTTVSP